MRFILRSKLLCQLLHFGLYPIVRKRGRLVIKVAYKMLSSAIITSTEMKLTKTVPLAAALSVELDLQNTMSQVYVAIALTYFIIKAMGKDWGDVRERHNIMY